MNPRDLKARTKNYALAILKLYVSLPKSTEAQILGKQMLRSGTSVGAHYREAQPAKSNADLISKFESGLQELEETGYWLELLVESERVAPSDVSELFSETEQLIAMLVAAVKHLKVNKG